MAKYRKRIGLLGFGKISQFLVQEWASDQSFRELCEIDFVWNRSGLFRSQVPDEIAILEHLDQLRERDVDLIVELAHPDVTRTWGVKILQHADLLVGSPTVFCQQAFEDSLNEACQSTESRLFCAKGALMGLDDLLAFGKQGDLESLSIKMEKAPESIRYSGPVAGQEEPYDAKKVSQKQIIFKGPVRQLAQYAPNNVNTMVVAALASGVGLDQVHGELVACPGIDYHAVHWQAKAKSRPGEQAFTVEMTKINPAAHGAVTGARTFLSFKESVIRAVLGLASREGQIYFC